MAPNRQQSPNTATVASTMRQKQIVPSSMMKKVTHRMQQLQEELALESVTNIEFEQSSRRSFEFLAAQVNTLKAAFNNLTDTFLQELEHLSGAVSNEFGRFEESFMKDMGDIQRLEKRVEHITDELDSVLNVVPKIEDSVLRSNHHFEDGLEQMGNSLQKVEEKVEQKLEQKCSQLERNITRQMEQAVQKLEEKMEQKLERKCSQLESSITRQMEARNRISTSEADRGESRGMLSQSLGGGWGGSCSSPNLKDSARERAWSETRERPRLDGDKSPFASSSPMSIGGRESYFRGRRDSVSTNRFGMAETSPTKNGRRLVDFDSPLKGAR